MPFCAQPYRVSHYAVSYWIITAFLRTTVHSHALPRPTPTLPLREFSVDLWPLAPTNPPLGPDDLLRRQFNTVCGYIGGDPTLPATCSAGSHCAADSKNGIIGCCPDEGPCTQGIFTGCVDRNSNPQTEINPYVFTCSGSDVCYQNKFDGGYFQYGCGSASSLANTVAIAPSGVTKVDIASVSVDLTASATSLTKPTTIGTGTRLSSSTASSETIPSATSTLPASSRLESATSSRTTTSNISTSTSLSISAPLSTNTEVGSAPKNEDKGTNVGAIVGGAVGGVAGIALLLALAIWLWRRRSRNSREGPGLNQSSDDITPMTDNRQQFSQLPTTWEEPEPEAPPHVVNAQNGIGIATTPGHSTQYYDSNSSVSRNGAAVGGSRPYEADREPLTRELHDFSRGFNTAIDDIDSNDEAQPNSNGMGAYTRSRGDGGPLWQQNRQNRNLMWM